MPGSRYISSQSKFSRRFICLRIRPTRLEPRLVPDLPNPYYKKDFVSSSVWWGTKTNIAQRRDICFSPSSKLPNEGSVSLPITQISRRRNQPISDPAQPMPASNQSPLLSHSNNPSQG